MRIKLSELKKFIRLAIQEQADMSGKYAARSTDVTSVDAEELGDHPIIAEFEDEE